MTRSDVYLAAQRLHNVAVMRHNCNISRRHSAGCLKTESLGSAGHGTQPPRRGADRRRAADPPARLAGRPPLSKMPSVLALALLLGAVLPPPAGANNALWPRIHFTPPCFHAGGPHDIAGALYLEGRWHVMTYCHDGNWQHIISDDLVSWRLAQPAPTLFGGTGGMLLEEPGKVVVYAATGSARHAQHCPACPSGPAAKGAAGKKDACSWECPTNAACACPRRANCSEPSEWSCSPTSNCEFWVNASADLTEWKQDNHTRFPPSNETNCDRVWRDSGRWWAFTAGRIGGYGDGGSRGAQENFYGNRALQGAGALHGAGAMWAALPQPFLTNNESVVIAWAPAALRVRLRGLLSANAGRIRF